MDIYHRIFRVVIEGDEFDLIDLGSYDDYETAIETYNTTLLAFPQDGVILVSYMQISSMKTVVWLSDFDKLSQQLNDRILLRLNSELHFNPKWQSDFI